MATARGRMRQLCCPRTPSSMPPPAWRVSCSYCSRCTAIPPELVTALRDAIRRVASANVRCPRRCAPESRCCRDALGIGGTEKGLVSFARELDRSALRPHRDLPRWGRAPPGRARARRCAGAPGGRATRTALSSCYSGVDDRARLPRGCRRADRAARRAGGPGSARLVETNIFGQRRSRRRTRRLRLPPVHVVDVPDCATARVWAQRTTRSFHRRHKVLRLPIEHQEAAPPDAPPEDEARRRLGLDPDRPGGRARGARRRPEVA